MNIVHRVKLIRLKRSPDEIGFASNSSYVLIIDELVGKNAVVIAKHAVTRKTPAPHPKLLLNWFIDHTQYGETAMLTHYYMLELNIN